MLRVAQFMVRSHMTHSAFFRRSVGLLIAISVLALAGCGNDEKVVTAEGVELSPEELQMKAELNNPDMFKPVTSDEDEAPVEEAFVLNKTSQVSVLCYHDFALKSSSNSMVIQDTKFRSQMQAIKDAGIPVVPMSDMLAWLRGEKNLPDPCIVITIDDGWKAVHSIAMPIFKEFDFPFTVYLYTQYVNTGGRSLTYQEIEELRLNGAEIGCHSVSHTNMATTNRSKGPEAYEAYLRKELGSSKEFLESKFKVEILTFAYPFGIYSDEAIKIAEDYGYEALFTVNGRLAKWDDPRAELGRFVIHGNNDSNFKLATSFRGRGNLADTMTLAADAEDLPFEVSPAPEATIKTRRPTIEVDLSKMDRIDEDSLFLKVAGFGKVPAVYDPESKVLSYTVPQKLRNQEVLVQFSVRMPGQSKPTMLPWRFYIDRDALYLEPPVVEEQEPVAVPVAEPAA